MCLSSLIKVLLQNGQPDFDGAVHVVGCLAAYDDLYGVA